MTDVSPTETADQAALGDNLPPEPIDDLYDELKSRADEITKTGNDWITKRPVIDDYETDGRATQFCKQVAAHTSAVDKARLARSKPLRAEIKASDARFNALKEPLVIAAKLVNSVLDAYLARKETAEKAARVEAEKDALRKVEEAAALKRRVMEDEARARRAEEAADLKRKAEAVKRQAEEAAAREHKTKEAEALKRKAEEAATIKRKAEEAEKAATAEAADRDVIGDRVRADQAEKAAKVATKAVSKAFKPTGVRSDYGQHASVTKFWTHEITAIEKVDLEALRQHFDGDTIDKAIRAFIKIGGRDLDGVRIYQDSRTVVR